MDTVTGQNELMEEFGKGAFSFIIVEDMPMKDVAKLKARIELFAADCPDVANGIHGNISGGRAVEKDRHHSGMIGVEFPVKRSCKITHSHFNSGAGADGAGGPGDGGDKSQL